MPEPIWIDRSEELPSLARTLESYASIGLDTEFLRERTFFPKLCLLQLAAGDTVWCVDTLRVGSLEPLRPALTTAASRKLIHSARQDLEAFYLSVKRVISPVFDTQIAAGCVGLKPQIGYAELAKKLLDVTLPKGQTRTDWSKRPLTREQLDYAADDVLYLGEIAGRLTERLRALGRESWVLQDCLALEDARLYEPDAGMAWTRLRGLRQLAPAPRARARALAVWREKLARERNLPRGWIIPDAAIFDLARINPSSRAALEAVRSVPQPMNNAIAESLLETLREDSRTEVTDQEPGQDSRPTSEQRAVIDRLARLVDARAAQLGVSAEILASRGELKALAMGERDLNALTGWRLKEIGEKLLEAVG
ncbi:MAG: ribonuclease D [Steroidobacteraceae bacterium]